MRRRQIIKILERELEMCRVGLETSMWAKDTKAWRHFSRRYTTAEKCIAWLGVATRSWEEKPKKP